jgi:hypothetical protein
MAHEIVKCGQAGRNVDSRLVLILTHINKLSQYFHSARTEEVRLLPHTMASTLRDRPIIAIECGLK